jgi:SAM-dependent methyltransferase
VGGGEGGSDALLSSSSESEVEAVGADGSRLMSSRLMSSGGGAQVDDEQRICDWARLLSDSMRASSILPVVETSRYCLYCGDGIELLQNLPDCCVAVITCDPPYQMNLGHWDKKWTEEQWACITKHVWRVLKPGGRFIVFGVRDFGFEVQLRVMGAKAPSPIAVDTRTWIHGDRYAMNQRNPQYVYGTEENFYVFHQRKGCRENATLAPEARANSTFEHAKEKGSMKPPALYEQIVNAYDPSGVGIVLDFCMGEGTATTRFARFHVARFHVFSPVMLSYHSLPFCQQAGHAVLVLSKPVANSSGPRSI